MFANVNPDASLPIELTPEAFIFYALRMASCHYCGQPADFIDGNCKASCFGCTDGPDWTTDPDEDGDTLRGK